MCFLKLKNENLYYYKNMLIYFQSELEYSCVVQK